MMPGDLSVHQFPATGQTIRTVFRDGEPWFVAADLCAALEIANSRDAVSRLDADEKDVGTTDTPGGPQRMTIVSEPGLYELISQSRKSEAKAFRRWVRHDVLPEIRQTGRYQAEPPDELELAERNVELIKEKRAALARAMAAEQALGIAAPKADAWQALADSEGDFSVREAAYILNRDPNISTGQNRLFAFMKQLKVIDRWKRPYHDHEKHVCLRPTKFRKVGEDTDSNGHQVRVTVEGLRYLHKKIGGTAPFSSLLAEPEPDPVAPAALPRQYAPEALFEVEV